MSRPGRVTDFLFFATIFTVTFAKVQWEVAGTLSLSDVLTAFFLVAFVGTGWRPATGASPTERSSRPASSASSCSST